MSNSRYPLRQVILDDLMEHNKVALVLLVAVIISALLTIWITHTTRLMVAEQDTLVHMNKKLENQYTHLKLEEMSKSQKSRIEAVAEKFELRPIQKEQEVILVR